MCALRGQDRGRRLEKDSTVYCCDHCAAAEGVSGLRDRFGALATIVVGITRV